jgi:hypothetical protein
VKRKRLGLLLCDLADAYDGGAERPPGRLSGGFSVAGPACPGDRETTKTILTHFVIQDQWATGAARSCYEQSRDAMWDGSTKTADFDVRAERKLRARTAHEVVQVSADLPDHADDEVLELRGVFGSVKREGGWLVPRTLRIHRRMGSVELDFTHANMRYPVIRIELDTFGGSVEARVPEEASVSLDAVAVTLGSVQDHREEPPINGTPHFEFVGHLRWGSLEVRGPRRPRHKILGH